MEPLEVIREAQAKELTDEDGEQVELTLLPGLDDTALREFEATLPCALPQPIRELLRFCRGFEGVVGDQVDFTGRDIGFEHDALVPNSLPIASDGFGNFWVVDLSSPSTDFGPIWFVCHDAPVLLYQSPNLREFLIELFKLYQPPYRSLVDDVHEDRIRNVWRNNPGVLDFQACVDSTDDVLCEFAESLDPSYEIIDLRGAQVGDGFSWGRYGPKTVVKRHGPHPVFAYQRKAGLLRRLFGR